jgi:hypothetical protein
MENTEKKERVTYKVDSANKTVTVHHFTDTLSDGQWFDTTFDMSKISDEERLVLAARTSVITWRSSAGVKKLTAAEIVEKGLGNVTVDLSATTTRTKHVETEEEKRMKLLMQVIMSGKDIPGVLTVLQAKKELLSMPAFMEKVDEKVEESVEDLSEDAIAAGLAALEGDEAKNVSE